MAFNPDTYLKEKIGASDGFDPDKYLTAKVGSPSPAEISKIESAARGAAQGATFGFAPAIAGAVEAVPTALNVATGSGKLKDILDAYNKAREASKGKFEAAQAANPAFSLAGNIVGGLVPAALTGGVSAEASAAKGLASALPISAETAAGGLTGAGYGALAGAGQAVSGGEDLSQGLKDVGAGAAGGALLGGAVSKAGDLLSKNLGPEALKQAASERALKATGISKGQLKNIIKQDVKAGSYAASQGEEAPDSLVQKMGSLLIEKNPYTETPVVTAGATPEVILERSQDLAQKSGADIGNVLKQFDQSLTSSSPGVTSKYFNPADAAKEVESQLLDPIRVNGEVPPVSVPTARAIQNVLDTINQYGNQPIPFEKAQELKTLLANLSNYDVEGSASNQILKRAGGIINKQIEDSADDVAQAINKPDLADRYQKAKDLYKAAMTAQNASAGKVAGGIVNRDFGITDYMAGVAGAAAHGTGTGMLAMAGNKLAKTYGNAALASGARATSNILSGLNTALVDAPKETIVNLGQQMINKGGALETSLGNVLLKAGERDDIGRNALIFSLMQNSGYRNLLRQYMGSKEVNK